MPSDSRSPASQPAGDGDTASPADVGTEGRFEVSREQRHLSVFDFIDAALGPVDRKAVVAAARKGAIHLNGEPTVAGAHLAEGDIITLSTEPEALRRQIPGQLPILYRDDELIVGDKPSGLPFDVGRRGSDSAMSRLNQELPPSRRPRALHRLDKQTSGLVVAAQTESLERSLDEALRGEDAWVEYTAVVRGAPLEESGCIDLPLGKNNKAAVRLIPDPDRGAPAATLWWVEERLRGFSVLRLRPVGVGRSHQVRAHLAALGYPAMGDALYGEDDRLMLSQLKLDYRPKRGRPERPLLTRPALHAARAHLPPAAGSQTPRRIEAPLPKDLTVLLSQLRRLFPLA